MFLYFERQCSFSCVATCDANGPCLWSRAPELGSTLTPLWAIVDMGLFVYGIDSPMIEAFQMVNRIQFQMVGTTWPSPITH